MTDIESPASDAVLAASHPSPECGGPCATCAFRPGTEANRSRHTLALARLCVEGITEFKCHEQTQLCRGWIAAVNLRGFPKTDADILHAKKSAMCAEFLAESIETAVKADR